jgi:hypothetical protein
MRLSACHYLPVDWVIHPIFILFSSTLPIQVLVAIVFTSTANRVRAMVVSSPKPSCVPHGRYLKRSPFFSPPTSRHLISSATVIRASNDNPYCNRLSSFNYYMNIACLLMRIVLYDNKVSI